MPASFAVTWLRLLTRMTDPDPRGRPTASEAATALRLMRQGGVDTRPLGATTGPRSTTKRARLLLVAALAAAIAVSIFAVGLRRTRWACVTSVSGRATAGGGGDARDRKISGITGLGEGYTLGDVVAR
ncbi:MAG: hypothetical protein ACXV5Q_17590, partial [Frankiaceae bacterium]